MTHNEMPPGWTEEEIRKLAEYYDNQTEEEAIAEAEAAYADPNNCVVLVPKELMPEIHVLLAQYYSRKELRNVSDAVALAVDLPEHHLAKGQVGTIIEILPHNVYKVEFKDAGGKTYSTLPLKPDQFLILHHEPAA